LPGFEDIQPSSSSATRRRAARGSAGLLSRLHAQWFYRVAHWLWLRRLRFLGRFVSHLGRFFTGIEIHPGATIGRGFFIDHGMGVVIGETAEIGENVTLYHGVTLGGVSWRKEKRHPTVGDHVVVGAGAKGAGADHHRRALAHRRQLGGGQGCPPHSVVVGVPGRVRVIAPVRWWRMHSTKTCSTTGDLHDTTMETQHLVAHHELLNRWPNVAAADRSARGAASGHVAVRRSAARATPCCTGNCSRRDCRSA
jgi:serine O-acetyltransferase